MALKTFIEAVREGLHEEMARDESVIVLGEDVGKKGGVFLATDGLWAEFGEDRKSTRLNSSHMSISYAVFCLKKKKNIVFTIISTQTDIIQSDFTRLGGKKRPR